MTKKETNSTAAASIKLEGAEAENFNAVKTHMQATLPGIKPNSADVLRYALNVAVESLHDAVPAGAE